MAKAFDASDILYVGDRVHACVRVSWEGVEAILSDYRWREDLSGWMLEDVFAAYAPAMPEWARTLGPRAFEVDEAAGLFLVGPELADENDDAA